MRPRATMGVCKLGLGLSFSGHGGINHLIGGEGGIHFAFRPKTLINSVVQNRPTYWFSHVGPTLVVAPKGQALISESFGQLSKSMVIYIYIYIYIYTYAHSFGFGLSNMCPPAASQGKATALGLAKGGYGKIFLAGHDEAALGGARNGGGGGGEVGIQAGPFPTN